MHVHQHESLAILREDVGAVQLRERRAEGMFLGAGQERRRRRPRQRPLVAHRGRDRPRIARGLIERPAHPALRVRRSAVAGAQPLCTPCGRGGGEVRLRARQGALHGAKGKVMNLAAVTETHFELGRMGVHVHELRIERQVEHISGMAAVIQHVPVRKSDGVHQQPVTHAAAIDEPELLVRLRARARRQACPTGQHDGPRRVPHGDRSGRKVPAEYLLEAREVGARAAHRRGIQQHPRAVAQAKAHVKARQHQPLHELRDVRELGRFAAHELAPRRHIEEQVTHLDGGAWRVRRRAHGRQRTPVEVDLRRVLGAGGTRDDPQP